MSLNPISPVPMVCCVGCGVRGSYRTWYTKCSGSILFDLYSFCLLKYERFAAEPPARRKNSRPKYIKPSSIAHVGSALPYETSDKSGTCTCCEVLGRAEGADVSSFLASKHAQFCYERRAIRSCIARTVLLVPLVDASVTMYMYMYLYMYINTCIPVYAMTSVAS